MADFLPRTLTCPRCGWAVEVVEQRATVMPGEVVVDFTVRHECDDPRSGVEMDALRHEQGEANA